MDGENIKVIVNGKKVPLNSFMKKLFNSIIVDLLKLLKRRDDTEEILSYTISVGNTEDV